MAVVGKVIKQPDEQFAISADFAAELVDSDSISSVVTKVTNVATGVDSSSTIKDGAPTIAGTIVTQKVKAGSDQETHRVEFEIATALARVYEAEIDLFIQET